MAEPIARDPNYRRRRFEGEVIELCVRWYMVTLGAKGRQLSEEPPLSVRIALAIFILASFSKRSNVGS